MKKSIKKLVVGTMAGAMALMSVGVNTTEAASVMGDETIVAKIVTTNSNYNLKANRFYQVPSNQTSTEDLVDSETISSKRHEKVYDVSRLFGDATSVMGKQYWYFKFESSVASTNAVYSIELQDDKGNVIGSANPLLPMSDISSGGYLVQSNLVYYDVNYDGVVDITDAEMVLDFALGIETPSKLQIMMGDDDGDLKLEASDAQAILNSL